jgi:hypothetical protein
MPPMDEPRPQDRPAPRAPAAGLVAWVHRAADLTVDSGANAGDALPAPADSVAGDYYRLAEGARALALRLDLGGGAGRVALGSEVGRPGDPVAVEGRITLMASDGDRIEVLVLAVPGAGRLALPLAPLRPGALSSLIAADAGPVPFRLADALAGAFAEGTRILLADGRQVPVEGLEPGAMILTRDRGGQPLRWRGVVRLRAEGAFAPVAVEPGIMGNPRPLVVSPHHRLFLYAPEARALAGAADLLVQARHLVDGRTVRRREGGVVVYHGLVFDAHEVIYAEGVPCESLQVCPEALTRMPADLAEALGTAFPGLAQRVHAGADAGPEVVSRLRGRAG